MCVSHDDFSKGILDGLSAVERQRTERKLKGAMFDMQIDGDPYDWYIFGYYLGYSFNHGDILDE